MHSALFPIPRIGFRVAKNFNTRREATYYTIHFHQLDIYFTFHFHRHPYLHLCTRLYQKVPKRPQINWSNGKRSK